jgi:hypothetical protein
MKRTTAHSPKAHPKSQKSRNDRASEPSRTSSSANWPKPVYSVSHTRRKTMPFRLGRKWTISRSPISWTRDPGGGGASGILVSH